MCHNADHKVLFAETYRKPVKVDDETVYDTYELSLVEWATPPRDDIVPTVTYALSAAVQSHKPIYRHTVWQGTMSLRPRPQAQRKAIEIFDTFINAGTIPTDALTLDEVYLWAVSHVDETQDDFDM